MKKIEDTVLIEIDFAAQPNPKDIECLTKAINEETLEYGVAEPFSFILKEDSTIIGGVNGFVLYGTIYTDQLWIDKPYRHKGHARNLMEHVHNLGRSKNCAIATVQTMSFQNAQKFYESLGYAKDFERHGYIKGSSCIFLKKELVEAS